MTLRKFKDKGKILTFQQPVLHKNTILYNANQNVTNMRAQSFNLNSPTKSLRSLMLNFNYGSQKRRDSLPWKIT